MRASSILGRTVMRVLCGCKFNVTVHLKSPVRCVLL